LSNGRTVRRLVGHHANSVSSVAVTAGGKWVVSASLDHTLKLWDLQTGRAVRTLEGHSASVNDVAVTPDERWAGSVPWDKTLKVWDLASGQAIATFHCDAVAPRCAFADQSRIVAGDQGGRVYFLTFEQ